MTNRRPLNVSFRKGSHAEKVYRSCAGLPTREVIAPGVQPSPAHDLHFQGGKIIADLRFQNFYIGADRWPKGDMQNIDQKLAAAMSDAQLNNVMQQYFPGNITTTFDGSHPLVGPAPVAFSQGDVEALIQQMIQKGALTAVDFASTVLNFLLPPGTVLNDDSTTSPLRRESPVISGAQKSPVAHTVDSLHGLGGYHGSVHTPDKRAVYYAIGVYSQILPDGTENGIVAFDQPWKNVVATFYHELNEARTDADVEDAIRAGNDPNAMNFLGWISQQGEECGDFPVFEVGSDLSKVFQEVRLTTGGGTAPVQFQYSNAVHGPEGPVATPEKKAR